MSKEMRRKKALRLQVKRGSFLVAALASVAVGGLSTVGAEEVVSTDTQPSVEVSSTTEKPTESVSSPSESSNSSSSTEGSESTKPTTEVSPTESTNKSEETPKESEKPTPSVSETNPSSSEKPKESTSSNDTKFSGTSSSGSESDKKPSTEGSTTSEKDKGDKPSSEKSSDSEGSNSNTDKPKDDVEVKPEKSDNGGGSSTSESEKPKEETPKEESKEDSNEEPKEEDPKETPKENPKEEPKEDNQVDEKKPELKFEDSSKVEQVGQSYLVNSDSRLKVSVSFNKQSVTDLKLIQKLPNGVFEEFDTTEGYLLPVNSTLELSYKDSEGKSQTMYLGTLEDKATISLSVVKADKSTVEVGANLVITGDSLPGTISATSSDGKYKLTGILNSENTYVFDGSVLYSGDYTFGVESGSSSTFGRKLGTVTFDIKGGEQTLPAPTPTPLPNPTPNPTPTPSVDVTPTPNTGGSTNTNTDKPTPTPNPSPEPTPTVPSTPSAPVTPTPSIPVETPNTDNQGGGTVIVNPSAPNTDTTHGNSNTNPSNGGNVDIGGVSDKTNYVDSPDKLTVGVSDGSVRDVKATVSSQNGTTELTGRVVNGSFVADNLPEKDGVYTVKVQVTDDKGQVSEKIITYAVNKNGSTYNWLNKEVNGAYYQYLSEDLKLSEHSTTRLDTGKTKFTFTLDGKVVSLDSRQVKVVEKKEDDGSYTYTYTFDKSAFRDNGVWSISVATVDVDGHASSSNASVQFKFVLDNIAPELKIEGILNNGKYDTAKHQFKVLVKDNIGLARVRVLINGKVYEFTRSELEKGEKILDLERSDKPYTIEVEVVDLAGNTTTQKVDGITVTASDIQALLNSDTVKLVLGALGVGAFAGLLAWWGSSVRKRKALEAELERYRIGAHLVTEAEGILSSSGGSSTEDTGLTESATGPVDMETVLAEGVASLGRDTGSVESSGKLSVLGSEQGEETSILETEELDADEHTSILTSEEEEVEHTTILDSGEEEHTSVLDDSTDEEHTTVLDEEDGEHTSVLGEEETTPLEERTTILDNDSEAK